MAAFMRAVVEAARHIGEKVRNGNYSGHGSRLSENFFERKRAGRFAQKLRILNSGDQPYIGSRNWLKLR